MDTNVRVAVILELADALRRASDWCGAAHLQKTAYFLQELTGVELEHDFILHKHGPFSFDLQDEITEMVTYNLMDFQLNAAPYAPNLVPSKLGKKLQREQSKAIQEYQPAIKFVAVHLGDRGVAQLERLGIALLVTLEGKAISPNERATRVRELGPYITEAQAGEAVLEVDNIQERWGD